MNNTEYFEVERPDGPARCSDNDCPCGIPGALIHPGEGYLLITQEVVDFRQDARTTRENRAKKERIASELGALVIFANEGGGVPILMCEQAARARQLDLEMAAADAAHWWRTGQVPLRPTAVIGPTGKINPSAANPGDAEDQPERAQGRRDQSWLASLLSRFRGGA